MAKVLCKLLGLLDAFCCQWRVGRDASRRACRGGVLAGLGVQRPIHSELGKAGQRNGYGGDGMSSRLGFGASCPVGGNLAVWSGPVASGEMNIPHGGLRRPLLS